MDNVDKIKLLHQELKKLQDSLEDITLSDDGELEVIMDGNIQIKKLTWVKKIVDPSLYTTIFQTTTNKAILKVSEKIKSSAQTLAKNMKWDFDFYHCCW